MIVIIDRPGQLCNRLWAITPFVALSLKHNIRLYVTHFDDYDKYFENVNRYENINIGLFKNYYSYRAFIKVLNTLKVKNLCNRVFIYDEKLGSFEESKNLLTRNHTVNLIKSWHQPVDTSNICEYKNEIRQLFLPDNKTIDYVDNFFNNFKKSKSIVIGVHLRRGDYKYFMNGKYFFNDETYKSYMKAIEKELKEQFNDIIFLLCSNSEIVEDNYNQFNTKRILDSTPIQDLYALSKCDYIFGPPSTFSMWASFYGDVPIKFIKSSNEQINISEFSSVIAQNKFKNGRSFTL